MPGLNASRKTRGILLALVAAVLVFYAAWIGSAYFKNYELQEYLNSVAVQATVQSPPVTLGEIQNEIAAKASTLGLPVQAKNVQVFFQSTPSRFVHVSLDYRVNVDFKFYTLSLHFTPSADNRRFI